MVDAHYHRTAGDCTEVEGDLDWVPEGRTRSFVFEDACMAMKRMEFVDNYQPEWSHRIRCPWGSCLESVWHCLSENVRLLSKS